MGGRRLAAVLLAAAALAACGGRTDAADGADGAPADDTLRYVVREVTRSAPCPVVPDSAPPTPTDACVEVELAFPDSIVAAVPALADSVRAFVARAVLTAPFDSLPSPSAEAVADTFVRAFETAYQESPAPWQRWFLEQSAEVACNDARVLGLRGTGSQHTGGAHPIAWARLATYDARDGRRLDLAALVVPESLPALTAAAERAFRLAREIPAGTSLADAGFTELEGGRFRLPGDALLCPDSVSFHFDAYEIAPYVVGPSDWSLPTAAVLPFLRPGSPLHR